EGHVFNPGHGITFDPDVMHQEEYVVVGVLEPTNSPSDRVVWIPIEGIFRMGGHVLRGTGTEYTAAEGQAIPDEHKEVSAVMLKLKHKAMGFQLAGRINQRGKVATLAWPIAQVMLELFEKIGWMTKVLALIAILVCVVAAFAILASIYNTMNERRREFAILRALGATRSIVFGVVTCEAAAIALFGALLGYVVYAGIVLIAGWVVREQTGVVLDPWQTHAIMLWMPLGAGAVGAVAGLIPALKAYTTNVASNLVPQT
ncbi:MAG: ABC transporter permease, partial [Planctomycetota bacterium]